MAGTRKLTPAAVRKIFRSTGPAKDDASRYDVSLNLVYLIRQGKVHKPITEKLAAPVRSRGRGPSKASTARIDVKALANAIVEGLTARLVGKAGR